jgi:predicted nucleic acid-binding protein
MPESKGLDTTFLVCVEIKEHPSHSEAKKLLQGLLEEGGPLGLAPQVLSEFVHVVSDPRRFELPLPIEEALQRASWWWQAREIRQIYPTGKSTDKFLRWMAEYRLGRKRLLDTQLAATYSCAGFCTIVTTNPRDFRLFPEISMLQP